jgi:hypothetical protein
LNRNMLPIFTLLAALMLTGTSFYTPQRSGDDLPQRGVEEIAINYLISAPTFAYDGIPGSVDIIGVLAMESYPVQYVVTIAFYCSHAGYGDRTGQILAQIITSHEIRVKIVEGWVVSAVIDERWDELNHREEGKDEPLSPNQVKDLAVQYIIENYPELGVEMPGYWAFDVITPQGLIGSTMMRFTGEGWEVNMSYPVVLNPVYTVSIGYSGVIAFQWEGSVDSMGVVKEDHMSVGSVILSQEDTRDIIISYLVEIHAGVEAPSEWTVEDLTPGGIVGYFTQEFQGGDWTVTVGNPVVWKPVFEVEVEYSGDISFTWKGTVDQTGRVEATQ